MAEVVGGGRKLDPNPAAKCLSTFACRDDDHVWTGYGANSSHASLIEEDSMRAFDGQQQAGE